MYFILCAIACHCEKIKIYLLGGCCVYLHDADAEISCSFWQILEEIALFEEKKELGEYRIEWNVRRWIFYLRGVLYYTSKVAVNNLDDYMQMCHRKTDTIVLYCLETLYFIYTRVCTYNIYICRQAILGKLIK